MRVSVAWFIAGFLFAVALNPECVQGDLLTQMDSFNSGTMGWSGGANPTYMVHGGPTGTGDGYLQLSRSTSYEFHVAAKNKAQWTGDYLSAGVTAIQVDLNHFSGSDPLNVRIMLWGDGGVWGSSVVTPVASGWNTYTFGLGTADLSFVNLDVSGQPPGQGGGSGFLADTLQQVNMIQLRHDYAGAPTPPGSHPAHIHGTLGIDNIAAIPEPASLAYLLLGGGGTFFVRRFRKGR